jgi:prephenate dehydrogenase/chorismate mutase/prephenate dehydrogenase
MNTAHQHWQMNQAQTITVVGGRGTMGRFFVERLSVAGHFVQILEQDDWHRAETLLGEADLVLLCVPLPSTLAVIQRVAPYLTPTTVLADIASVKEPFVQAMLEYHSGPVIGLHPMFGPGTLSFLSQTVVVCPGRQPETLQWFFNLIEAEGGKLITCTPEEHDRMMIVVQAIRHFSTFSLGVFLAEEGIDIARSLDFATPLYRSVINSVSRLFAQDDFLSLELMLASADRGDAIQRLVNTCDRLSKLLNEGNREALRTEFEMARQSFQPTEHYQHLEKMLRPLVCSHPD